MEPLLAAPRLRLARATACALFVALACLALGAAAASAAFPGNNGKIAFNRFNLSTTATEIWTVNPDGSSPALLVQNAFLPAWSPDGTKLAFTRTGTIWTIGANGSNPTQISTGTLDGYPAWSPDGSRLAFVRNNPPQIWVMNADGSNPHKIKGGNAYDPSWSPTGSPIAFEHASTSPAHISTMWPDGSHTTSLVPSTNAPGEPDWSPDGAQVVFDDNIGIGVVDASGANLHHLTPTGLPGPGRWPAWSPDGTNIAVASGASSSQATWVFPVAGGSATQVSFPPTGWTDQEATWQPRPMTLVPTAINFGSHPDHSETAYRTVTLTNHTGGDVSVSGVVLTGPDATSFQTRRDNCTGHSLGDGASCTAQVRFRPLGTGVKTARLEFSDTGPNSPQAVALSGTGTPGPWLQTSVGALKFGKWTVGTTSPSKSVTLTNVGSASMTISAITITGANPGDFTGLSENCTALASLGPGESCAASVAFTPTATGTRAATMTISDSAPKSPHKVALSGTGV